jgi:hypothetical protein
VTAAPLRRLPALLWLVGVFLVVGVGAALAYWTVTVAYAPTNYALGLSDSLSAPTSPTATATGSGSITIGWSLPGSQLPGAQYRVTRTSPSPQTICTVSSSTTSCADTGLTAGTLYSYSVAAVLSSWASSTIAASATTSTPTFAITLTTGPYTAGTPITLATIKAMVGAVVDTTYTGSKTLNWTGLSSSPSGQGPTYPASAVSFTSGQASPGTTFTAYLAGSNTLTATDSAASGVMGSTTFSVGNASASKLSFTTQPSDGIANTALATQPAVTVQDAFGNTVITDTSNVTLALTTPAGATLTCTANPQAAVYGITTFAGCKVNNTGTYTLTATDGVLTSAVSSSFTISVGTAAKLAFSTQPGNGTGGTALTAQPAVTVQDAGGNTVTTDTSNVTLALTTPAGATLTCTANPKAAVSGITTFAGCKVDKTGTYTLTATDGTLTSAVSNSFTISVGTAAKLAFSTQPGNGTGGTALTTQPAVTVQDAGGNTVTTDTSNVTLTLTTAAGATLTCTANPKTAAAGIATFAGCKVDKTGTYSLTTTDGGLTTAISGSFTISVGTAAGFTFTSSSRALAFSDPNTCTTSYAKGNGVTWVSKISVVDAGGNLTTASGTLSVSITQSNPTKATLSPTTLTIASGSTESTASFTMMSNNSSGFSNTITASLSGFTSGTCTATLV